MLWTGRAWQSFFTTLELAAIAAPLTAIIGLLTAYLLNRQHFLGKNSFEFMTMLSFAIPGTVIGVSYIVAFNVPPIELTGTGLILIICFVFRNMPVSIRAGLATLSQIDKSLDECSLTLRHGSFATLRRVILPLLRPAIIASLVYAFVRAITSVSAVIFLVSAQYNLATAYIVGRVEISDFGVAIAYSSVLIVCMLAGDRHHPARRRRAAPRAARRSRPLAVPGGRLMSIADRSAAVVLDKVRKQYGAVDRGRGGVDHHRGRHPGHAAGPVRLRQDHDPAHDRGPGDADRRPHPDRRQGRHPAAAERARRQHGVPVLRAVPAHDGAGERLLRPGRVRAQQGAAAGQGPRGPAPGRPRRL